MKKLALLFVVLAFGATAAVAGEGGFSPEKINLEQLKELKASGEEFVLIDSRGGKYLDGEVIEGSVSLPVDQQTEEKLAAIVPNKETKIVFYCSNTACQASEFGGYKAKVAGYRNVYKFPGGIAEWKEKGLPLSKL